MPDEALRRVHQLARNQGMPRIIQNFQYERAPGEPLLPQENVNVVETEKGDETEEQAAEVIAEPPEHDEANNHNR